MNVEAVIMMVIAMIVLWGGLGLAIFRLVRHDPGSPEDFHRDL